MKAEHTARAGVICSGCAAALLLAPAAFDAAPAPSGVGANPGFLTCIACAPCTDPVDQDREPGKDLIRACQRMDALRPGPAPGRPAAASPSIRASRRHLLMISPKQGPPVPPLASQHNG